MEEREADYFCLSHVSSSSCSQKQDPGLAALCLLQLKQTC